jgi:hypothetical protein
MDHEVRLVRQPVGALDRVERDGEAPLVAGRQVEPAGVREREGALGLGKVVGQPVAHVEQGAGVVVGDRADPRDAGQAQEQRERQRALVERREDDRGVERECAHVGHERVDVRRVHRLGLRVDPGGAPAAHVVDAGQQAGGLAAAGAAEERHPAGGRRDGAHGRAGEQHVPVVVLTDDEDVRAVVGQRRPRRAP